MVHVAGCSWQDSYHRQADDAVCLLAVADMAEILAPGRFPLEGDPCNFVMNVMVPIDRRIPVVFSCPFSYDRMFWQLKSHA
jgi:hypothetical protein